MKIQVLSDLHLEHGGFVPEHHPAADVIVLAGDLAPYTEGLVDQLADQWSSAPHILYVLGNHEFYGTEIDEARDGGCNRRSSRSRSSKRAPFRRPAHPFAPAHDLTVPHIEAGADEHCGAGHRGEVGKSAEYGRADEHRPNHAAVDKWREQRGRREHEGPDGEVLPERIAQPDPDQQKPVRVARRAP